ncbi:hypothetical protein ACFUJ0_06205 [Streptomyces sp. NPDC057242]|uniref:hypothetical protein n=1 Tax=unclassified Streptomyces TaxID=2593676 RepID=UPI00362AA7C8
MTGPEHVQEAETLLRMARLSDKSSASSAAGAARAAGAQAHALLALVAARSAPAAPPAAQAVTVYRAAYEDSPFPLGLYANPEAARAHCEAVVSDEYPAGTALLFEWSVDEDEPESVCELDVRIGDETTPTGYTVTAVVAEAAYDPEADA